MGKKRKKLTRLEKDILKVTNRPTRVEEETFGRLSQLFDTKDKEKSNEPK